MVMLIGAGDDSAGSVVQSPTRDDGLGHADMSCGSGRVFGTMAGGGGVPPARRSPLAAAGLVDCGRLGVTLPCAFAKSSRLRPEVSDDRSPCYTYALSS